MTAVRPVLLTAFEPFDGHQVNASWLAAEQVARTWSADTPLVVELLPVSFARAPAVLAEALARHTPAVVLATGEAGGRARVGVERVAVNVVDATIPDADGWQPVDEPVLPGGPVGHWSGLPVRACVDAVARTGLPVEVSGTAGGYVCNAVFYHLMAAVEGTDVRAGFVHLPRTPAQAGDGPALVTADSALAVATILATTLAAGPVRSGPPG